MTTNRPTNIDKSEGARRARTLRWLLKLRTAHHLPMPKRIDFSQLDPTTELSALRYLTLTLDNDTDVTGWATALDAERRDDLRVTGKNHTWTHVIARTVLRSDGPRVDWHLIEVVSNRHYQCRTDLQAVTA